MVDARPPAGVDPKRIRAELEQELGDFGAVADDGDGQRSQPDPRAAPVCRALELAGPAAQLAGDARDVAATDRVEEVALRWDRRAGEGGQCQGPDGGASQGPASLPAPARSASRDEDAAADAAIGALNRADSQAGGARRPLMKP